MSDVGEAAGKIGDKLVEILDIFDLSFFIAGAVAMGAILASSDVAAIVGDLDGPLVFGLVLGSYVLGLAGFGVGRSLRNLVVSQTTVEEDALRRAITTQGLAWGELAADVHTHFGYRPGSGDVWAFYTRMWVHVRSYAALSESFALLKRYWVLSASYDGIAVASFVWLLPIWTKWSGHSPMLWTVLILVISGFCWHRALQYKLYQIDELVATVAHWLTLVGKPVLADLDPPADVAARTDP